LGEVFNAVAHGYITLIVRLLAVK